MLSVRILETSLQPAHRLGPSQHTQYSLSPILGTGSDPIVAAALGQDHTLVLTKTGEVYSWGLNRFSQLGYIVELPTTSGGSVRTEEPIQAVPKKVPGLKGQFVRGVAASKNASACWTAEHVYTWGTNSGQLGYDKAAQPVQIVPRIVTKVPKPVIMVAMSDNAMTCLLESFDVLLFANDRQVKIK
jgi:alpha-tubulin suppressor-like RCC1 family protein